MKWNETPIGMHIPNWGLYKLYSRKENLDMNNKLVYGLAGGAIGAVIGYLVADWLAYQLDEAAFQAELDATEEELESMVAEINERMQDGVISKEEAREQLVGGMDQELYEFDEDGNVPQTNYAGIVTMDETVENAALARPYQAESAPYIMDIDEWAESKKPFDRHTIMYYVEDNTYCDESEEIIDDINARIVPNAHLHFGEGSDDEDIVYICNPQRGEMFEIIQMHASYDVEVNGNVPDDSPKAGSGRKRDARAGSKKKGASKKDVKSDESASDSVEA